MSPTVVLLLATVAASDPVPQPSALPAEARKLRPLAQSDLGRAFLNAAEGAPPYAPRTVYRRGQTREWLDAAAYARLAGADRAAWTPVTVSEGTYQGLFYGSPLAYLLPLERLAGAGFGGLRGKRVADFGHGGIGQLRLFAELGAEAVGIDVDPIQPTLYGADQGPLGKAAGSVKLVHGRFPADPKAVAAVGGGYDLFLSKNTLKRGYVHPAEKVDPRLLVDLGADDPIFLKAVAAALKPGGWLVIYNLSPAPNAAGKPYRPMADGRCPFSAEDLAAVGFETVVRDGEDDTAARASRDRPRLGPAAGQHEAGRRPVRPGHGRPQEAARGVRRTGTRGVRRPRCERTAAFPNGRRPTTGEPVDGRPVLLVRDLVAHAGGHHDLQLVARACPPKRLLGRGEGDAARPRSGSSGRSRR